MPTVVFRVSYMSLDDTEMAARAVDASVSTERPVVKQKRGEAPLAAGIYFCMFVAVFSRR
jgi:hypothetical protein